MVNPNQFLEQPCGYVGTISVYNSDWGEWTYYHLYFESGVLKYKYSFQKMVSGQISIEEGG